MEDKLWDYSDLTISIPAEYSGEKPNYVCPGAVAPVSRAVHLARLHAAWPGCDQCSLRHDTEGLGQQSVESVERIRDLRGQGIQRTEFGIRGPYLNRIDRRIIGGLSQVFCQSLLISRRPASEELPVSVRFRPNPKEEDNTPRYAAIPSIVIGFDGRSSSPDIVAGVISAVREYGLHVIDTGRSTAGSLMEAVRQFPEAVGAMFVTGAGFPPSYTGLDILDRFGESVPVAWKEFGIHLEAVSPGSGGASSESIEEFPEQTSARSKWLSRVLCLPEDRERPTENDAQQVGRSGYRRGFRSLRIARSSGTHNIVEFESRYRQWLLRWYPEGCRCRIIAECSDSLIIDRLQWVAEQRGIEFLHRDSVISGERPHGAMIIRIRDDDTQFEVFSTSGVWVTPQEMSDRINRSAKLRSMHLTAHADSGSGRFWITDAGRPHGGEPTEDIRDALAILGLWIRCQ
ncbi:MAG: hypothetical protein JNL58_22575 [Planctomyces sp.]|nr:hypothetical protein [Planctomyces sp.]